MVERIPSTRAGYEKLQEELQKLKHEDRPRIVKEIETARAHGDLSENAEYHAAKEKQGFLEARLKEVEAILGLAEIIEHDTDGDPPERVVFGTRVKLEHLDTGETVEYYIVGEHESNLDAGMLSVKSPVARAMIGKELDEEIQVRAPGGLRSYIILDITY